MSKSYRTSCSILFAALVMITTAPSPASAGGPIELTAGPSTPRRAVVAPPARIDEQAARRVILESYRALAELAHAGGTDLRFGISDLRTFHGAEMDSVLWLDLVTMPEGRVVDVSRQRHTDRSSGAVAAAYRASWRDLPADWVLTMEGQELIGSTAREVLARAALSDHELAGVVALTSFEVDAAMAGAERGYRAAFLWLSAPDGQMRFRAIDLITQSVEHALSDRASVAPPESPDGGIRSVTAASGTCYTSTTNHPANPAQVTNANDHVTGYHYAEAGFNVRCECTSACVSKCESSVTSSTCGESWTSFTVSGCHRQGTNEATQSHTNVDGMSGGAECTAGWGCGVKACIGCLCSVSVTVSIVGGQVEMASDANVWAKSFEHKVTCAPCQEYVPTGGGGGEIRGPFHQDPDPYGGGGGGGSWSGSYGGGCWWQCTTYWDGSEYSESCTLIC